MKAAENHLRPSRRIVPVLAALLAAVGMLSLSFGQAAAEDDDQQFTVSKWAYKQLNGAHQAISKAQYDQALDLMNKMKGRSRLNDHERALMWQTFGYIHSAKEQFSKAIQAFEKCLSMNAMHEQAAIDTQYNLGQLYMANEQFAEGARVLSDWIKKVDKPSAQAKYLLAMALTQTKNHRRALHWATQAVAAKKPPPESWLQLLLSLHYELDQKAEMANVLERLIRRSPEKKSYWMQLYAVYSRLGRKERALALLELAYDQGFLTSHHELMNLASLYLHHAIPRKAAEVMERGLEAGIIKNDPKILTQLGDAHMRARDYDRAIVNLSRAAKASATGDLWVRVAQLHMERQEWTKAIGALRRSLQKSGNTERDKGNAHLLMGICYHRKNNPRAARDAFLQAKSIDATRKSAQSWLEVVAPKTK